MAYISKKEAKSILDSIGVAYDDDASRDELIEMLEAVGHDTGDNGSDEETEVDSEEDSEDEQEAPEEVEEESDADTQVDEDEGYSEGSEQDYDEGEDEGEDEEQEEVKLNKDGLVPGDPVSFKDIVALRNKKKGK